MPRVLAIILAVALWVYGLIDCAQTPEEKMPPGLPKPVWMLIILLVPGLGALAWLVVKLLAQSQGGSATRKRKGPTAPDDDPEFLAKLDWQARKAHYERQKRQREAAGAAGATEGADTPEPAGEPEPQPAPEEGEEKG